jgi:hypothetical protein
MGGDMKLFKLFLTYHVIKQCTEKETTSLSIFLLTIKLNYIHDLKIVFQCLLHLITQFIEITLACKPIFQKKNTLCEKTSIEVEGNILI